MGPIKAQRVKPITEHNLKTSQSNESELIEKTKRPDKKKKLDDKTM